MPKALSNIIGRCVLLILLGPSNAPDQRLARVRANKKYLLLQSAVSGCSDVNRVIMFDLILYQGKINSEWWLFAYV